MKQVKLEKRALQFTDTGCFGSVVEDESSKGPKFECLAYSGGVIKNHWFWGDLVIDLEGMSFPKEKMPILEDHDTSKKIGFATKFSIDGNRLMVQEATLLSTPESLKFQENSKAGFPYEASIYAKPSSIEEVGEDEEVEVNGFTFTGPGNIWRKCTFKEVSVCTFGYDSNTSSAAMSETEEFTIDYLTHTKDVKINSKEDTKGMNREKFKTDHQDEYNKLVEEVTVTLTEKFTAEKQALEAKLTAALDDNTKLSTENKETEKRILALEKQEALRAEKELGFMADKIFTDRFSESGLPDRLSAKIKRLIPHDAFVSDGKLDTDAFASAVDAELKDWSDSASAIQGFSTGGRDLGIGDKSKDTDSCVDRMLKYIQ